MINFEERALIKQSNLKRKAFSGLLAASLMLSGAFGVIMPALAQQQKKEDDGLNYSDLIEKIEAGEVERVEIDEAEQVAKVYLWKKLSEQPEKVKVFDDNPKLIEKFRDNKVEFTEVSSENSRVNIGLVLNVTLRSLPLLGLFMLLFFIPSKNGDTLEKNSGTVEKKIGTVRNLEKKEKIFGGFVENNDSFNAYQASIANRYEVWSFIIDCVDQDGNTLYYTSVYFKAREINGVLHDGDEVEVEGIYDKDTKILKPEVIFNKTGNSYIEIVWKNEFDNIK